ncbi:MULTISPECIES: alkane 1-monooxygenase [unclassified Limnobacter]|jgi:alkane 1-monooxygenase|uniref:alkane 1-monooxygenase n=3 Tax=Limnobacter TaxID=131079 RepID=UPI000C408BC0|nr:MULTISPECIES: alkane 1-monooxygenase [unclassified Limnobacter]MAG80574.1 alkane 1-monooxygenase [Sutterellaceae bacterium]MBT85073.1 alkane 1-monooxygenase [Sutterellaceae bacterium]HAV75304.1 alkane 1-monooxygenase [Limnobacter sp.]|tara:strand:- start:22858 stop:24018 length:1161 start_codon:yes stop_codon:yes gene_type:complete
MTSNTMPATQYKDPKKYMWLLSVIAPFAAPLGPIMYLYTGHTQWLWIFLAFFYLGLPVLDFVFGEDKQNPPEQAVPELENTKYYRVITYLLVPIITFGFLFNVVFLATHDLHWLHWLAVAITTGSLLGFGLNLGHEMGHKKRKLDKALALFTLSLGGYGHFSIEHNRGHHRDVATPEDPATSRMGEHIYEFMLREIPGAFKRAWRLESERLERAGKSRWNAGNEMLQAGAMTLVLYTALIAMFGWPMVPVLAVVAFWGAFQLTSANYIEHYGLMRQKLPNGEYERCAPHHSWNSNHLVSNLVVFQLQRHSDHHANPARSYQSLRDFPELPSLPSGYFGMFLIAYVPPLWFAIMNPRLLEVAGKNAQKINIHPSKRARVIQRYSLAA